MSVEISWDAGVVVVAGEVDAATVDDLEGRLAQLDLVAELDMGELDLLDGVSVARLVTALRALARRQGTLRVRGAPQMLAHTLYKSGLLGGALELVDPRVDEPTTAN